MPCFGVLPRSLGGQRSIAYLISFTQRLDSDTQLVFVCSIKLTSLACRNDRKFVMMMKWNDGLLAFVPSKLCASVIIVSDVNLHVNTAHGTTKTLFTTGIPHYKIPRQKLKLHNHNGQSGTSTCSCSLPLLLCQ